MRIDSHPGRLLLEEMMRTDSKKVKQAAERCREELHQFSELSKGFYTGKVRFNPERYNLEEGETALTPTSSGCLNLYQVSCLKHQVTLFIKNLDISDNDSREYIAGYLFNKILRLSKEEEKLTASPEADTWKTKKLEGDFRWANAVWGTFDTRLEKMIKGTWKTTEQKAEIIFEQYEENCIIFEKKIEKNKKEFSMKCEEIIQDIEKREKNGWLKRERTQTARNTLYAHIKKIKDQDPLNVDGSIIDFLKSKELLDMIQPAASLIDQIKALSDILTKNKVDLKDSKSGIIRAGNELKKQIDQKWEQAVQWEDFIDHTNEMLMAMFPPEEK